MSYKPPIGDHPPDPYDGYKAEPIEPDKKDKEKIFQHPNSSSSSSIGFTAYILSLFYNFLALFEKDQKTSSSRSLRSNLEELRNIFFVLQKEDRSFDTKFLEELALIWQQIIEELLLFTEGQPFAKQLKQLIKSINTYPEENSFSLGYYLTEYANRKWLPFPFMELIRQLHEEHQKRPHQSQLTIWTVELSDLLKKTPP